MCITNLPTNIRSFQQTKNNQTLILLKETKILPQMERNSPFSHPRQSLQLHFLCHGFRLVVQPVEGGHHITVLCPAVLVRQLVESVARNGHDM